MKFLFFLSCLFLSACSTIQKPHFYSVTNPQGEKGYLLGTMHIGVPINDLPGEVMEQFQNSDPVFVEVDLSSPSLIDYESQSFVVAFSQDIRKAKIMRATPAHLEEERAAIEKRIKEMEARVQDWQIPISAPVPGGLRTRFTEAEWDYISQVLHPLYPTQREIDELNVETVAVFVSASKKQEVMISSGKAQRLDPQWSMDLQLAKRARNSGKTIQTLDSKNTFPPHCMTEFYLDHIRLTLHHTGEQLMEQLDQLESHYRSGDPERIQSLMARQFQSPVLEKCLLKDRNQMWLPKIQKTLSQSKASSRPPFFAFGAAHLYGPEGIIELLKAKGYEVRRVEK